MKRSFSKHQRASSKPRPSSPSILSAASRRSATRRPDRLALLMGGQFRLAAQLYAAVLSAHAPLSEWKPAPLLPIAARTLSGSRVDAAVDVDRSPPTPSASASCVAYNPGNFLRTQATPDPIKVWSLTSLQGKLIKIGAKVSGLVCRFPLGLGRHFTA